MAGTFPDNTIFESMEIISDANMLTTVDGNNNLYGSFARQTTSPPPPARGFTHAWEFELTSKPLTRSEMAPIMAFLTKQNGSAETFEITPPQTASRNDDTDRDRILYIAGPSSALDKGEAGVIFNIEALGNSPDFDNDGGAIQIFPGDFLRFTSHNKVYMFVGQTFTVPCENFDGSLVGQNGYIWPVAQQDFTSGMEFQLNPSFKVALVEEPVVLETDIDSVVRFKIRVREEAYA